YSRLLTINQAQLYNVLKKKLPMAENINLLPQQNDENTAQARQRRMINQISIIALVLSIVAVVVLFSGQFILGQQIKGIEEEIQTQQSRIQAKKAEEGIQ